MTPPTIATATPRRASQRPAASREATASPITFSPEAIRERIRSTRRMRSLGTRRSQHREALRAGVERRGLRVTVEERVAPHARRVDAGTVEAFESFALPDRV